MRSKNIIHFPSGEKYFCDGTYKHFCKNILSKIKPQPHRKYFNRILKTKSPIDGWYIEEVNKEFKNKEYKKYEY